MFGLVGGATEEGGRAPGPAHPGLQGHRPQALGQAAHHARLT